MTSSMTIIDELHYPVIGTGRNGNGEPTFQIVGSFYVDGLRYDADDASHEIRPMYEVYDDGERCHPARWCPTPVTEAEMRAFIHTGMLDGRWQG